MQMFFTTAVLLVLLPSALSETCTDLQVQNEQCCCTFVDQNALQNAVNMYLTSTWTGPDISLWDTHLVNMMEWTFIDQVDFNGDISGWDTAGVASFAWMLRGTSSFNADISEWDISGVTSDTDLYPPSNTNFGGSLDAMFHGAATFNADLSKWDVSGATSLESLFQNAAAFNAELSGWNVSAATNMNLMFNGATAFDQCLDSASFPGTASDTDMFVGSLGSSAAAPLGENCPTTNAPSAAPTTTAPTATDYCAAFTRKECHSTQATRWLGCSWSRTDGSCVVRDPSFVQPDPLDCGGHACCSLNKRACRGIGVHARAWSIDNGGTSPRRVCRYTKDKSMQNQTPDGKNFAQCMSKN